MRTKFTLIAMLFGLAMGNLQAQIFTEFTGNNNPLDGIDVGKYNTPSFVDIDGDGDLDLVSGNYNGIFKVYQYDHNTKTYTKLTGAETQLMIWMSVILAFLLFSILTVMATWIWCREKSLADLECFNMIITQKPILN